MDFYRIVEKEANKKGVTDVYPDYTVASSSDLMIRGGKFYAVYDEASGLWSTKELDVARMVDEDIRNYELKEPAIEVHRKFLRNFGTNTWQQFRLFCTTLPNTPWDLDQQIIFADTPVTKESHATKRLPYAMAEGDISAYDELVSVLYSPEERAKFEWAIGAIISGDSKTIHKMLVFFGKPGEGKSTIMNIVEDLFEGYTMTFEVAEIVGGNSQFALAQFKDNALVAIDQDGDLSKVQDNTRLNKLISHDKIIINEKHKTQYEIRPSAFSMVGTNKPVRITDAKSGLVRRILDVRPTGQLHSVRKYEKLVKQVRFELGAIAHHCLKRYLEMGKDYYVGYVPLGMMMETDVFFNFIEYHFDIFESQNGCTLKQAWDLWKEWLDETRTKWDMPYHKFREELKNYFDNWEERAVVNDVRVRNWYSEFNASKYKKPVENTDTSDSRVMSLVLEETESLLDKRHANAPAQLSKENGLPEKYWTNSPKIDRKTNEEFIPKPHQVVSTKLRDLDTREEHYVKIPEDEIVIDFDLRNEAGEKDPARNLEAAAAWPPTYAEFSKSGGGIHLHYRWLGGDPERLSRVHSPGIEVKVFTGDSSLRRKVSRCNALPVADLSSGLVLREEKVIDPNIVSTEQGLRKSIGKALRKEVHSSTKSNMDFIKYVLDNAHREGLEFDVTDMRPKVIQFARSSTNQWRECSAMLQNMKFKSEKEESTGIPAPKDSQLVIFDVEVFPNLFVVCWKFQGASDDEVHTMVNPSAQEIEFLLTMRLVGYNNRHYDNHILYAAALGYTNEELYRASQQIINNSPNAKFREAYNLSETDIFDFASIKQTLKQWEIDLGLKHNELGLPWDEPVDPALWEKVAEYCRDDVNATDAVFVHLKADYLARGILAELSGLNMNATTQQHAARIIFGTDRTPQPKFKYEALADRFPGYEFNPYEKRSIYKGEEVGEGGLVRAKPGMWEDVWLFDIESMHPTSIEILNLFGEYTSRYSEIKDARVAIKQGNYEKAREMFGGRLGPYLVDEDLADSLSYALKIVINIVYGLTSAGFDNMFKDPRNVDNIVAKIGALFMMDLKEEIEKRGGLIIHIKTDSIKLVSPTNELIDFIMEYSAAFGYKFVHEATYSKMCLVNHAVYVAKYGWSVKKKDIGTWVTVGAQFAHPYVKKTLFTREKIEFKDLCEAKSARSAIWLDFEGVEDTPMALGGNDTRHFIGKTGLFTPVTSGGGTLVRETSTPGRMDAVTGTKNFLWLESETVELLDKKDLVDMSYFNGLVDKAIANIRNYGDFEQFAS